MNSVGIEFYRLVSEDVLDSWAQVYVRVPFEEGEWRKKGALFGVVKLDGANQLAERGAELLEKLDEKYNQLERGGDMQQWVKSSEKGEVSSAWVWVVEEDGRRVAKMWATGEAEIKIKRNGKWTKLIALGGQNKVISGQIKEGDKLLVSVGKIGDWEFDEFGEDLAEKMGNNEAWAGLLMEVKPGEDGEETEELEEKVDDRKESEEVKITETVEKPKRKRQVLLILGGIFLTLLVISVTVGVIKMRLDGEARKWTSFVEPLEKKQTEAVAMTNTNRLGAMKLLTEVREDWQAHKSEFDKSKYQKNYVLFGQKLDEEWVKISGEKKAVHEVFLTLGLIRPNLLGNRLSGGGDRLVVMDKDAGLVVGVGVSDKNGVVIGGKVEQLIDVGADERMAVGLSDRGLVMKQGKQPDVMKDYDSAVIKPTAVEVFGDGVYVLDVGAGEIWKYIWTEGKWGDRRRWMKTGDGLHLSDMVDMAIDGDVWVLGDGNKVVKLRRGATEKMSLRGVPEGMVGYRLAVESGGNRLAVLDKTNGTIILFDKNTGEYMEQWNSDVLLKAEDLVFLADGKVMVLADGKLEKF